MELYEVQVVEVYEQDENLEACACLCGAASGGGGGGGSGKEPGE